VAEIVRDGTTGLLAPEGDGAAFAAALERLLPDPAERERMGCAAAAIAAAEHSLGAAASLLDQLVTTTRHSRGKTGGRIVAGRARARSRGLLQVHRASFETRPAGAPQDEVNR
jgi:hypothetical protein